MSNPTLLVVVSLLYEKFPRTLLGSYQELGINLSESQKYKNMNSYSKKPLHLGGGDGVAAYSAVEVVFASRSMAHLTNGSRVFVSFCESPRGGAKS